MLPFSYPSSSQTESSLTVPPKSHSCERFFWSVFFILTSWFVWNESDLKWCTIEMWVYGQRDPAAFRFEMLQSNRSFWSFLTESRIQQVYDNPPKVFVDGMYDLAPCFLLVQFSGMLNLLSRKASPQHFSTMAFRTTFCPTQTSLPTPKLPIYCEWNAWRRLFQFICSRIKKGEDRREKKTSSLSHVFLLPI
jgi:hypothetical protein